jgi:GxxExxY protein
LHDLTYLIVGAAIQVHKNLGPGLLERVYNKCLEHEFRLREIEYSSELAVPVTYKGLNIDTELRCDFLVENLIVVELKAVHEIIPLFEAQLLTHMKLLKRPKGILINFNCVNLFKEGQKIYVNNWFSELPDG